MEDTTPGQYFDATPAVASRRRTVHLTLPDATFELVTDSGVFSGDRVDAGTKLLLLDAPPPPVLAAPTGASAEPTAEASAEPNADQRPAADDVPALLDLGCGYGPIAVTLAHRAPTMTVWAVDVNERAVALCAENASATGATNLHALVAESPAAAEAAGMPAEVRFEAIYSNPPIRIGKAALHTLLRGWLDRLTATGQAHLVVQKHLGSDSLARWLDSIGWPTTRLASRAGYRILTVGPRRPDLAGSAPPGDAQLPPTAGAGTA